MPIRQCPVCHNTNTQLFHLDHRKHAIVCDICGSTQNSSDSLGEQLQYDLDRQKAISFIKGGAYYEAKPLLERMRQQKPDDQAIYYLHLMGLSECGTKYDLNSADASLAQQYLAAFKRLGGDLSIFIRYGNARRQKLLADEEKIVSQNGTILSFALTLILVSAIFCLAEIYIFLLGIAAGVILILWKECVQEIWNAKKREKNIREADTPFFNNIQ